MFPATFVCVPLFQLKDVELVCCGCFGKTMCAYYEQDNIECWLKLGFPIQLQSDHGFWSLNNFKTGYNNPSNTLTCQMAKLTSFHMDRLWTLVCLSREHAFYLVRQCSHYYDLF